MTHSEIEAFFSACRHKNITKAAEELFITQSSLSTRLKTLEETLGCALLIRSKGKREISLTAQGQAFYDLARQYRDIVQKMGAVGRDAAAANLYISAIDSVGNYLLPPVLERFLKHYPHIRLSLQEMEAEMTCLSIIRGKTDLAFSTSKVETDQIVAIPFLSEPFALICSTESPYGDQVALEDLIPENEIYIRWSADYEFWHQSAFGPVPLYQAHLDIMGQIELFVSQPGKWTFAPKSVAEHLCSSPRLRQCIPSFRIPNRSLYLLRHRDTAETANVRCFLDTLRDVLLEQNTEGMLL